METQRLLRLDMAGGSTTIVQCVDKARALKSVEVSKPGSVRGNSSPAAANARPSGGGSRVCYNCGQVGHFKRDCPKKQANSGGPKCYGCHEFRHIRRNCPKNGASKQAAGAAATSDNLPAARKILASAGDGADLPRIYVDVTASSSVQSNIWKRFCAVVDKGAARSLVNMETVLALGLENTMETTIECLQAIDGSPLKLLGSVSLCLRRMDSSAVHLPCQSSSFLVVENLGVVSGDVLIGTDFIGALGGVRVGFDESTGELSSVMFGPVPVASSTKTHQTSLPHGTKVSHDGDDVYIDLDDARVCWKSDPGYWEVQWKWSDGKAPEQLGSGIGQYSLSRLTEEQLQQYSSEIETWISEGWLIPYEEATHGKIGAVLPLMAVAQKHKPSTPVYDQ